jgi:hypothetical protein
MTITFSRRLAVILGVGAPLAETVRRWRQLGQVDVLPFWLDDYFIGALLLYGAWRTSKDVSSGRRFLAAAWGFTCGMAYSSFFAQLERLNEPDPAPIPSTWVAVIKGVGLALAILALVGSLKRLKEERDEEHASHDKMAGA